MLKENHIFECAHELLNDQDIKFQQDGATCHIAKKTKDFIKEKIDLIEDWPTNSPDRSPIENLWGIMKNKMQDKSPPSIAEFKELLKNEWNEISIELINNLITKIPHRMIMCLSNKGKQIGHLLYKMKQNERPDVKSKPMLPAFPFLVPSEEILTIFEPTLQTNSENDNEIAFGCVFDDPATVFIFQERSFHFLLHGRIVINYIDQMYILKILHIDSNCTTISQAIDYDPQPKMQKTGVTLLIPYCDERLKIWFIRLRDSDKVIQLANILMRIAENLHANQEKYPHLSKSPTNTLLDDET
jgi:hypothetical protein